MPDNLSGWVMAGGGGTLIGSIIMGLIQTLGKRGKEHADAADVSLSAATKMMDRLQRENENMRAAMVLTLEAIEAIVAELPPTSSAKSLAREARQTLIKSLS